MAKRLWNSGVVPTTATVACLNPRTTDRIRQFTSGAKRRG